MGLTHSAIGKFHLDFCRCIGITIVLVPTLLVSLLVAVDAGANQGVPQTLCVVHQDPVDGLETDALRVAIALEKRRIGAAFNRLDAPSLDDCPPGPRIVVVLVGARDAWWQGADGRPQAMEIGSMDPRDRAPEVARRIVAFLARPSDSSTLPIVQDGLHPPHARIPQPEESATCRGDAIGTCDRHWGYLRAGGRYEYQPGVRLHAGTLEIEAGVSLLGERLALGLKGGWQPATTTQGQGTGATAQVTAVPLALLFRGGMVWRRVAVRAGLGAGLEWRRVRLHLPSSSTSPASSGIFPTIDVELDLSIVCNRYLRVVVGASVRGFPSWTDYFVAGRQVLEGARVGLGTFLRLETLFGAAGR